MLLFVKCVSEHVCTDPVPQSHLGMVVCVFVLQFLLSFLIIHVISPSVAVSVDAVSFLPFPGLTAFGTKVNHFT